MSSEVARYGPHYDALLGCDLVTREILWYADNQTLGRLFQVNHFLRELSEENGFWRSRLICDFGKSKMNDLGNYRLTYIVNLFLQKINHLYKRWRDQGYSTVGNTTKIDLGKRLNRFIFECIQKYECSNQTIKNIIGYVRSISAAFNSMPLLIDLAKSGSEDLACELTIYRHPLVAYLSKKKIEEIADDDALQYNDEYNRDRLNGNTTAYNSPARMAGDDVKYWSGDKLLIYLERTSKRMPDFVTVPSHQLSLLIQYGFYKEAEYFHKSYVPITDTKVLYTLLNAYWVDESCIRSEFIQYCVYAKLKVDYDDFVELEKYISDQSMYLLESFYGVYPTKRYCEKNTPFKDDARPIALRHGVNLED